MAILHAIYGVLGPRRKVTTSTGFSAFSFKQQLTQETLPPPVATVAGGWGAVAGVAGLAGGWMGLGRGRAGAGLGWW